jgi:hypothetical protein
MNRWLQRLAELDGGGAPARTQDSVQFGQNGQNSRLSQQFGQFAHFVQIAQPPGSPAPPPPQAETAQPNDHSERPAEISSVAASSAPARRFVCALPKAPFDCGVGGRGDGDADHRTHATTTEWLRPETTISATPTHAAEAGAYES